MTKGRVIRDTVQCLESPVPLSRLCCTRARIRECWQRSHAMHDSIVRNNQRPGVFIASPDKNRLGIVHSARSLPTELSSAWPAQGSGEIAPICESSRAPADQGRRRALCGRGLPAPHAKPFTHDGPSHRARARFVQGAAEGVAAPVGIGKAYRYSTGSADRTTSRRSMKPPTSTPASPMTLTTIEVIDVSTRFVMNTG